MQLDGRKNWYVTFQGTRLTLVQSRPPQMNWSRGVVLRVQKYMDQSVSNALCTGPEIPIYSKDELIDLATEILALAKKL